jgi:hypothetical protein
MSQKPKIIRDVGIGVAWDPKKVWRLNEPVEEMAIAELLWHFDIPFWDKGGNEKFNLTEFNLTPWEVIKNPNKELVHFHKIHNADISHPIDIMENKGKWRILDGLHRLAQLYLKGDKTVRVRKIPRDRIPEILVD